MQPRLKSSKKWTAFPQEYAKQIETVFKENFEKKLAPGKVIVEGRIYPEEILLRIGLNYEGRLTQSNFEVSVDYNPSKKDAVERIHNCVDAAASMMLEYFDNNGDVEFPRTWQEFPFQGQNVYLQYSTENTDLEAQANALLGETTDDSLVHEDEVEEIAEAEKGPQMFGPGGKKKKTDLH